MNLGLDREETAADRSSQSVEAEAMVTWAGAEAVGCPYAVFE